MSGSRPSNRLAGESSPYLLLHRHNPVDWYPWGDEALERARREDRPIFLSVGYSTCYWCHVMERESFSEPAIAELMNRDFVNVKLDREERPELDEIYMAATQLLTGQGGWPNSVFLTPDLEPFFAGTYFPPEDRHGRPGFPSVLRSLAAAWRDRRDEVVEQASNLAEALRRYLEDRVPPSGSIPGPAVAERSLADLEARFDHQHGGFGGAPKFPTPSNLLLLEAFAGERPEAARMLRETLDRMARGGIYDQLGGGFHRYATDAAWRVPHFEKMLYDNGFLLELFAAGAERFGDSELSRIALETAAYLEREMTSPEGAFWSAQDAETDGDEGAFYVWDRAELQRVLGEEELGFLAPIYGFDRPPFFEGGRYVLHLPEPLEEQARRRRLDLAQLLEEIAPLRARLLEERGRRTPPRVDDKILADWNGIAVAGLAEAGRRLQRPRLVSQAAAAAEFVLREMRPGSGPLLHSWRAGRGRIPAFLADYVQMVRGCLALHRASGERRWLEAARELAAEQQKRLGEAGGGFWTAAASSDLLARGQEAFDGATPGSNGVAVLNLMELADRTGEPEWGERAREVLRHFGGLVERHPEATRTMTLALLRHHGGVAAAVALVRPASADDPVALTVETGETDRQGWRELRLRLEIARGWHLYAAGASGAGVRPTRLAGSRLEVERIDYPEGQTVELAAASAPVEVYTGRVEIGARVRPEGASAALILGYQACDDRRCLAPVERRIAIDG